MAIYLALAAISSRERAKGNRGEFEAKRADVALDAGVDVKTLDRIVDRPGGARLSGQGAAAAVHDEPNKRLDSRRNVLELQAPLSLRDGQLREQLVGERRRDGHDSSEVDAYFIAALKRALDLRTEQSRAATTGEHGSVLFSGLEVHHLDGRHRRADLYGSCGVCRIRRGRGRPALDPTDGRCWP